MAEREGGELNRQRRVRRDAGLMSPEEYERGWQAARESEFERRITELEGSRDEGERRLQEQDARLTKMELYLAAAMWLVTGLLAGGQHLVGFLRMVMAPEP